MRRVTATIPSYWEAEFESALLKSGLDAPEFIRSVVYDRVKELNYPTTVRLNHPMAVASPVTNMQIQEKDLYMKSAPERLKALSKLDSPQVCVRGQEIGEDHIIEPGQLFAWFRFSRDSQEPDWVKNGKLCRDCYDIAKEMWARGEQYL